MHFGAAGFHHDSPAHRARPIRDRKPRPQEILGAVLGLWLNFAGSARPGLQLVKLGTLTVDCMDLHILKAECGIGIHRHRDNQEIFFLLTGAGIMVTGDWCQFPDRERCFEIGTMTAGSFSLLKPGNLHALFNVTDEDISLLMFGGYD